MQVPAPLMIERRASSLCKATRSFIAVLQRDAETQQDVPMKALQLETLSHDLAALLVGGSEPKMVELRLAALQSAYEDLEASYHPPQPEQNWRDFVAWSNLSEVYGTLRSLILGIR